MGRIKYTKDLEKKVKDLEKDNKDLRKHFKHFKSQAKSFKKQRDQLRRVNSTFFENFNDLKWAYLHFRDENFKLKDDLVDLNKENIKLEKCMKVMEDKYQELWEKYN